MASITSLSNSSYNTSSIYGNRNVLSGLASGMDTETMIENAVAGYKLKIENLVKKRTKVEWQQEAYRSIIDKAVNFNNKYTSFSSKTNLLSQSFFNNAVNTTTAGKYADKITASGKTSSDIKINAVKQLAKSATYTVAGLGRKAGTTNTASVVGGKAFDINNEIDVSAVSGTLTFQYGGTNGTTFDIELDELENINEMEGDSQAERLANAIKDKLSKISYSYTKNGFTETTTADKVIKVDASSGVISFSDGLGMGNNVTISSATGRIKDELNITGTDTKALEVNSSLMTKTTAAEYLKGKELSITLDGVTKKIDMGNVTSALVGYDKSNDTFIKKLQGEVDKAFGANKVKVGLDSEGKMSFSAAKEGSTLSLSGSAVKAMGFEKGDSSYINVTKKLSELMDDSVFKNSNKIRGEFSEGGEPKLSANGKYYVDEKGNRVNKDGIRVDGSGEELYNFEVNGASIAVTKDTTLEGLMNSINSNAEAGVKVSYSQLTNEFKFTATESGAGSKIEFGALAGEMFGNPSAVASNRVDSSAKLSDVLGADQNYGDSYANFTMSVNGKDFSVHADGDSTMDSIVRDLNDMLSAVGEMDDESFKGVTASFDSATNSIVFKDKDGKTVESSAGSGLAKDLFEKIEPPTGARYTAGQDAVMDVEINGKRFENLTRSNNSFDIDGMIINVKDTFKTEGDEEPVTFKTTTDSDKIVDAIRSFVEDYNEMATEIKNAYSTLPDSKSNGSRYEPLTAEQEDEYSESELKSYNEKAKQGILFGDSNLSSMYSKLLSSIQPGGTDGQTLRDIGIGTSYSNGMTTLSLDEDKLRAALDSDPDKVKDAFAKTQEGGSATNGLMQSMQNALNTYVKTTGEPKGVLIARAGSIKSPASLNSNSLQSQMDNIDKEIDRWQDKIASQIDRYTTKFSRLEQLIAQMNSQSSAMMGLMGGSGGY